jgi:hypothetical protein
VNPKGLAGVRDYVAASAHLYTLALSEAEDLGVASGNRDAVAGILADLASDLALDAPNVARALPAVGGILGAASRMAFDLRDAARDARPLGDIVPGIRALCAMLEPLARG